MEGIMEGKKKKQKKNLIFQIMKLISQNHSKEIRRRKKEEEKVSNSEGSISEVDFKKVNVIFLKLNKENREDNKMKE